MSKKLKVCIQPQLMRGWEGDVEDTPDALMSVIIGLVGRGDVWLVAQALTSAYSIYHRPEGLNSFRCIGHVDNKPEGWTQTELPDLYRLPQTVGEPLWNLQPQNKEDPTTYITRPRVVNAVRWDGNNCPEITAFLPDHEVRYHTMEGLSIHTGVSYTPVPDGYWIIKRMNGNLTFMSDDEFQDTYKKPNG